MLKELTAVAIVIPVFFGPAQVAQDQVEDILARAARAYEDVSTLRSQFVQKIVIPALEREKEGRGVVYQKKPNLFMMQFEEPQGDVVVADGEWFWMYYPSAQPDQVVRTAIHQTTENATLGGEFLVNPTERYVAAYVTRETVGDRSAHLLSLVPKFDAPYTLVRVWIDASDYLVRKFEIHEENETVRTITLSSVEAGIDLPDDLFTFSIPPGVEVFTR
ncbi:MAG: outer membrane lipoprotein carrier protein LolA [Gemmatimonadota bacterium]|nr:MAG: outer membrane lipoprotein carrier protein LolA [Gemmatimonadota bacterium]